MNTPTKLGAFAAALLIALGAAYGVGRAVGPVGSETNGHDAMNMTNNDTTTTTTATHDMRAMTSGTSIPGGLMVSESGYTLELTSAIVAAGRTPVVFRITGPDGAPVTDYEVAHEKRLHLIVVRRDTTGFQHVHPTMDADGTWRTEVDLTPGVWRIYADFQPTALDDGLTLGIDASVAGDYDPVPIPAESRTSTVDGYTVTLAGDLTTEGSSELTLSVSKDGAPVTDLDPYLGAYGHLVALRAGDLAYLHVHPDGEPGDGETEPGPDVTFFATVPSGGWYRLFLDFEHEGVVRTAEFTLPASAAPTAAASTTAPADGHVGGH
jgi:hypothetical protein